jgi:hypothetical protein
MTTRRLWTAALLASIFSVSCGDSQTLEPLDSAAVQQELGNAPVAKTLNYAWQGQQTGYWCGPASTRIALTTRMTPPSQTTLANYLGTTTNGTNHIGLVANALNHYLGTNIYSGRNIGDPATAAQTDALKLSMVATISNGYPLVANVVSGWRPPGYPGGTIYHYVAVVGYDQGGDRALIADPAGQGAAGGSWNNVPSTYWVSLTNLAIWIGGKGYAGTSLPISPGTPPSNGTLIGTIYQQGSTTNRVAGAVVTVSGQSVTTAADGMYQFSLAPGAYTATVTKAGYGPNTVTRTVIAGAQAWGSMEINAQAATGSLKGKIYAFNSANPADLSQAVARAIVTAGGQTQTTAADGMYSFTLPAGTFAVTVAKAGFANNTVTRTVTIGATVWGSMGLTSATGPDLQPPQLAISFPSDAAQLDVAVFNLTGTASDDKGAVASVDISINGGAATAAPVAAGKFSLEVMLKPGPNTLKISGKDAAGNAASVTHTAVFNAGVSGFVHVDDDEAKRVTTASVVLLDKTTGAELAKSGLDATGAFSLAVMAVPVDAILVVTAEGFTTYREGFTVPADRSLQVKVGLLAGIDTPGTQANVAFTAPLDGATVTTERVTVSGLVSGFEVANVRVNGVLAALKEGGSFTVSVPLTLGQNTIEAVATGVGAESAKGTITLTRKAGPVVEEPPVGKPVGRGCSAVGFSGFELLAFLALAPLLRRRLSA